MPLVKLAAVSLAVILSWSVALTAQAQGPPSYNVTEAQSLYGYLNQDLTIPYSGGATWANMCGPVAAANSFVYLQNQYPSIYGQSLVPGNDYVNCQPSQADLISTADLVGSSTYMNTTGSGTQPQSATSGLSNYIQAFSPGTTVFSLQTTYCSPSTIPTWQFIYDALCDHGTVEISLQGVDGHYVSVTGFHWTDYSKDGVIGPSDGATINIVDPWTGAVQTLPIWQNSADDYVNTSYSSGYTGNVARVGPISQVLVAMPTQWNSLGSAVWSSTSSWLGPVPDGSGAKANFLNFATAPTTVTLDSSRTVGALNFDSPYAYSLVAAGSSTLTLAQSGAGTPYSGSATIAVTNVFGNGAHTIAAPLVLASPLIVTQNSFGALTIAAPISDGGNGYSLTMTGSGAMILTASNTYGGGTFLQGGTIVLGTHNSLPTAGTLTLGSSGTSGVFDLAGFNQQVGGLAVGSGATASNQVIGNSSTASNSTLTFSGAPGGNPLVGAGDGSSNFAGTIQDSLGSGNQTVNVVVAAGRLTLSGSSTYSGGTTIAGGAVLQLGSGTAAGSILGNVIDNGWLVFASPTAGQTFGGAISGSGGLSQVGPGSTVLAGSNTYTGGMMVTGGKLYLNGTCATAAISVFGGATLGGSGTASSAVATVSDAGNIEAGFSGVGSLTLAGLTFNSSGTIAIANIGNYALLPSVNVTGSNGLALNGAASAVSIALSGTLPVGTGTVHLLQYAGAIQGTGLSAFSPTLNTAGIIGLGARSSLVLTDTNSGYIDLNYSYDYPIWTGAGDGGWTTAAQSAKNWKLASNGNGTDYIANDTVVFDDSAVGTVVSISGTADVAPAIVTFNNNTSNYTLQGLYGITGSASLSKSGSASLIIATSANSYTGGTFLQSGTIALGIANGLPAAGALILGASNSSATLDLAGYNQQLGSLAVAAAAPAAGQVIGNSSTASNSTLTFNTTGSSSFPGTIQDTLGNGNQKVALTIIAGLLNLSGSNTFSGDTTISGGTLQLGGNSALYSGAAQGNLSVNNGVLDLGGYNVGVAGLSGAGTVTTSATGAATLTVGYANATCTFLGSINDGNGAVALTKAGSGTLLLSGSSSYSGGTTITGGVLQFGVAAPLLPGGALNVNGASAVLDLGAMSSTAGAVTLTSGTIQNGTLTGSSYAVQSGLISASLAGSAALAKSATGSVALLGSQAYTGLTTVTGGTLQLGDGTLGHDPSLATSGITVTGATLVYNVAGSQTVSYPITGSSCTLVKSGTGIVTFNNTAAVNFGCPQSAQSGYGVLEVNGGTLQYTGLTNDTGPYLTEIGIASGATLEMNVASGVTNGLGTLSTVFSGSGTLSKTGPGTLNLGYYYVGRYMNFSKGAMIDVIDGTVLGGAGTTGNFVNWSWQPNESSLSVSAGAIFDAYGDNVVVDALNGAGIVQEGVNTAVTLTVGIANGSGTFSGVLQNSAGTLALTKSGRGIQVLSGDNTYIGVTTISGGTLQIGAGGATGTLGDNSNVTDTATLIFSRSDNAYNYGGVISGAGTVGVTGGGTITFSGSNTYSGPTTIRAGVLKAGTANTLSPSSDLSINGGTLDSTGFVQTVKSLTVGPLGSLNLTIGTPFSSAGPASLNGSLNLFGGSSGTQELMSYSSSAGSGFSSVSGVPYGYAIAYNPTQLDLTYAPNDSVLGASTLAVSLGRMMLSTVSTANVTISNASGMLPTGLSAATSGLATVSPASFGPGTISASGSGNIVVGLTTNATGSYSGIVQVLNSGDGGFGGGPSSAGANQGSVQSPISINVTGTVVDNRVVTALPIDLGRFMANQNVGGTCTLSTTGDDSAYTRVTVNGTLFNSATSTSTYDLAAGTYTPGAVDGSVVLTTTGEGLAGENPINVTVAYMGNALLDRVVTATPITLGNAQGRFMASQSVGGASTLSTSGDDSMYTRVTVNGALFNSATTTSTYNLPTATYPAGPVSGSVVLRTTGEGLAGENPVNVTVGYTGNALLDRVVTATPITLGNAQGRFMANQSVSGTSSLSTSGDDSLYTRVTVNGTLFNSAATTSTYNLPAATYPAGPVSGSVVLPTTGEGLAGENPINVTVGYTGDALLDRVVTATSVTLGNAESRFMASQSVSGTSTLSTSGDDSLYTRVTVNGTLFNSATCTSTYGLTPATFPAGPVSGSVVLTTSGEGLGRREPDQRDGGLHG